MVPTVPFYLLVVGVAWCILVPGAWLSVPVGVVIFLAMWGATVADPHWFEILHQRTASYVWRLWRTRGRSRHLRRYKAAR